MVCSVDADKNGAAQIAHPLIHRDSSGEVEECKMVLRKYEAQDSKIICSWIKDAKQLYQWSADKIGRFPLNGNELNEYYASMNGVQSVIPLCAID